MGYTDEYKERDSCIEGFLFDVILFTLSVCVKH